MIVSEMIMTAGEMTMTAINKQNPHRFDGGICLTIPVTGV